MFFSFLHEYWWAVVAVMALIMVSFIFVTGGGAEGGLGGRTRKGWGKWRAVSRKAGEVQARVILTIFYFTIAAPFGLARTFLADPLRVKRTGTKPTWLPRETRDRTVDDARRQF
jgi:hypothetical protein